MSPTMSPTTNPDVNPAVNPNTGQDEFYVGYEEKAPEGIGRFMRSRVLLLLAIAGLVGVLLTALQSPFAVAFFDFGQPRAYEGVIRLVPHPVLEVERPASGEVSRYLLVAFGKKGAEAEIAGLDSQRVRLEGTPIYRDGQTMLEIVPGTVAGVGDGPSAASPIRLGDFTLEGEIVDSKCFLGVMKPGDTKPHRACASLCIRGGIPPLLLVRRGELPVAQLLLVGSDGEALNDAVLDLVAEPVRIRGEVVRMGDLYMLRADPANIERI